MNIYFNISAPTVDFVQTDWRDEPFCPDKEIYTGDVNGDNRYIFTKFKIPHSKFNLLNFK